MPPIRLSDAELDAVFRAARPLDVALRDAFLQRVASTLAEYREVGPGNVYRAIAAAQADYYSPPQHLPVGASQSRRRVG